MRIASGDPEASPTADAAAKRLHLDTKYEAQDVWSFAKDKWEQNYTKNKRHIMTYLK